MWTGSGGAGGLKSLYVVIAPGAQGPRPRASGRGPLGAPHQMGSQDLLGRERAEDVRKEMDKMRETFKHGKVRGEVPNRAEATEILNCSGLLQD